MGFLMVIMVIMASSIAQKQEDGNDDGAIAAILQITGWQRHAALVYTVFLLYWTSVLWSIRHLPKRYLLTSITWPYRGLKFRAHQGQLQLHLYISVSKIRVGVTEFLWKHSRYVSDTLSNDILETSFTRIKQNRLCMLTVVFILILHLATSVRRWRKEGAKFTIDVISTNVTLFTLMTHIHTVWMNFVYL